MNILTDSSSFSIPDGICGTARLIERYSGRSGSSSDRYMGIGLEASRALALNDSLLMAIVPEVWFQYQAFIADFRLLHLLGSAGVITPKDNRSPARWPSTDPTQGSNRKKKMYWCDLILRISGVSHPYLRKVSCATSDVTALRRPDWPPAPNRPTGDPRLDEMT